ncbi:MULTISPECIES: radical SAM/SPASM domain-containing protein [unclassified Paenibacillus]
MNRNIMLGQFTKVLTHGNKVILGNRRNGKWMKMSQECYEILKLAMQESATTNELIEAFEDQEDKEYFFELLQLLYKENLLADTEEMLLFDKNFSVDIAITNRCNLRCKHCCVDSDLTNLSDPLDTDVLKTVLNKVVKSKPKSICLTGGEPLIRKDFFEILSHLNDIYDGEIRVMTNGTLINSENVKQLVAHVSAIDFSIDGVNEDTCSTIRGKGVFNKVLHSVELLKNHHFDKISLSMVLTKENYVLRNQFEELNKELGTRGIARAFSPIGRGKDNKDSLQPKEKEVQIEEIRMMNLDIDDVHICLCGGLFKEIYINSKGQIYPCGLLERDKYYVGNILEIEDLSSFLGSGEFKKYDGYQNWEYLQPDKHEKCKDCDVNLFCWNCLHYLDLIESNDGFYESVCPELKRNFQRIVWED